MLSLLLRLERGIMIVHEWSAWNFQMTIFCNFFKIKILMFAQTRHPDPEF